MTAPAPHVTVADVPPLLPVAHAVDSSDDERERDTVRVADGVTLEPNVGERELVAATDREREVEAEREGETVGVSPAWHCT